MVLAIVDAKTLPLIPMQLSLLLQPVGPITATVSCVVWKESAAIASTVQ